MAPPAFDRDHMILVSFTFLVSHPIHEGALAKFDRHYPADHFHDEHEDGQAGKHCE
jgi:hypothetical protein